MLEKHEVLMRIAEIEKMPLPLEAVGSFGKKGWIYTYNPLKDMDELVALTKKYLVRTEFEGAGVKAQARVMDTHKLEFLYSDEVFNSSYEKAIVLSVINLFDNIFKGNPSNK